MAIFSFHIGAVSRSCGGKKRKDGSVRKMKTPRSCQVAAAYKRAGQVTIAGQTWSYARKKDVVPFGVYVPKSCPAIESMDLWAKADAAEKRKDATTAREGYAALPIECTPKEWAAIMCEFSAWMCETHKVAIDMNYHHEKGNPHIDFQFTTREYLPDGSLGAKTRQLDDLKVGPELVEAMRAEWAAICNQYLAKYGTNIDHRSYERQGLDKLPQIHLGQAAEELEAKGIRTERGDYNRAVRGINEEREQIILALQELRGGNYVNINGAGLSKNPGGVGKGISQNRNDTIRPSHQLPEHIQRGGECSDISLGGESARATEEGTGISDEETRGTFGSSASTNIHGNSRASSFAGEGKQRGITTQRRNRRVSRETRSSRNNSCRYQSTGSDIIVLVKRMRQNVMVQVEAANSKALTGVNLSLPYLGKIANAIQQLTRELKKAVTIANVKTLQEVRHGTQEAAEKESRGTGSYVEKTHGDARTAKKAPCVNER